MEQARDDTFAGVVGVPSNEAQAAHPDDRPALDPARQEQHRKASDGDTWVDPLIGAKFRTDINDRVYLTGWAMVGGFGLSSDNMWDVMGAVGYKFNDLFSVVVGYRGFGVDYSEDGFVYDVTQKGPVIGGVFKF